MNTNKKKALPLFVIGGFSLLIFVIVALAVNSEPRWVAKFDLNWISRIQTNISISKTNLIENLTMIGSAETAIILTLIVVVILFFLRKFVVGLWFGGTVLVCAVLLNTVLKDIFARPRPNFDRLIAETGFSFPSGHATGSTVFYGLSAMFLIFTVKQMWAKIVIGVVALGWIFFIMYSRVYLGVHYPTDVFGGFLFGVASIFISLGVYFLVREPLHNLLVKWRIKDRSIIK
ncbi:acid phosphatase/vanadium-dependent haloperoxidase family protein [Listeria weihenstephanensis FSL R9-0317]|uniref:Phosphatase PAP2 family protein n=1 Tax=Listeria weihenstephanensis TaxID=1006155 RepID=A0A1S7FTJ7_9LIST|nr:phosphatase PAP2 family protein [Listeria weihenstephanensis]AQY50723.1 phosphoesterase [Listeria weihenstephanensis]EUJ36185.1 acid phosphatase/vanadium-dependent haloperoxidase family protein [Listeria weihenstephanensis FSL R9-0317]MBC1499526.1 phosphatase PAP2 family protein [Listeria weihenstephanensis]